MIDKKNKPKKYKGIIEADPTLQPSPYGTKIIFEQIFLNGSIESETKLLSEDEVKKPVAIASDSVQGAIIGVCLDIGDGKTELIGTAFIIGPGIAVTASHVIRENQSDLASGKGRCICCAFRDNDLFFWELSSISLDDSDIAFLSINPLSKFPSNMTYYQFGLTTLTPKIGDTIRIIGYKQLERIESRDANKAYSGIVDVYITEGKITEFYLNGRDKVFLPFPCFEIDCGTLSGMSGGVAIDNRGFVVGVVSTSYGEQGPTYISWIVTAFRQAFKIDWPQGNETKTTLLKEATEASSGKKRVLIENHNSNLDASGNIQIPSQPIGGVSHGLASSEGSSTYY